jgi:hypothetical protein
VNTSTATVQITKLAAAQRQLDAAIRMFFAGEDELAIHTVVWAAFTILRNLNEKRGQQFTREAFRAGIFDLAKRYAAGRLAPKEKAMFEGSELMVLLDPLLDDIREQGSAFDESRIGIALTAKDEQRAWPSHAANFLKHADRDADKHLAVAKLNNEYLLVAATAAYLELIRQPTPEMKAFYAYWTLKNNFVDDLAEDALALAKKLQGTAELKRHRICTRFIREEKSRVHRHRERT